MNKNFAFCWDWKKQPNWKYIFNAIQELNSIGLTAYHYEIETGNDDYGLLISSTPSYNKTDAFSIWKKTINIL